MYGGSTEDDTESRIKPGGIDLTSRGRGHQLQVNGQTATVADAAWVTELSRALTQAQAAVQDLQAQLIRMRANHQTLSQKVAVLESALARVNSYE